MRPGRRYLALPVVLVGLALQACAPGRGIEAWRVLDDIAAGPGPSRLKEITPAPERTPVTYRIDGRGYAGDLYRPGDEALAALVLVPGAAPEGKDDPRLVAFAHTLARARFTVLVPEIENLRAMKVRPDDARAIADAVRHLVARAEPPGEPSVGLVAISYAAGPAVLAALQDDARDKVRVLVAVGGYQGTERLVTFFTTGAFRAEPDAPWRFATPNAYGKWIFLRSNAERVDDPRDRVLLTAMAERKLDDLEAEVSDLVARLGPEGRAVHDLLTNDDPDAVPGLIARLPKAIRDDMAGLDLARRDLSQLGAEMILIHGRDDAVIPYTESQALAAAVPADRVHLYLVDNLAHVDLGVGDLDDVVTLWRAAYRVLEIRDEAAGP